MPLPNPLLAIVGNPGPTRRNDHGRAPRMPFKPGEPVYRDVLPVEDVDFSKIQGGQEVLEHVPIFHKGPPTEVLVIELDDGRSDVTERAVMLVGTTPEITYDNAPEGSDKHGFRWRHEFKDQPFQVFDPTTGAVLLIAPPNKSIRVQDWYRG